MRRSTRFFKELQALEEAHPELKSADSPTVRVGGQVSDRFERTQHPRPMLSLQNAFTPEELSAWRDRVKTYCGRGETRPAVIHCGAEV